MPNHSKYPDEIRERAVLMMLEHQHEYGSQWEAICSVPDKFGRRSETVRKWDLEAAPVGGGCGLVVDLESVLVGRLGPLIGRGGADR